MQAVGVPGSLVRFGLALVDSSLRLTGAVLNGVGSLVLPGFLMSRLRGAWSILRMCSLRRWIWSVKSQNQSTVSLQTVALKQLLEEVLDGQTRLLAMYGQYGKL